MVLTTFSFGRASYLDGLLDQKVRWPASGIMIDVLNWSSKRLVRSKFPPGMLRIARADFRRVEGFTRSVADFQLSVDGQPLTGWVEFGRATPATIAAANQALAGVRVCSA